MKPEPCDHQDSLCHYEDRKKWQYWEWPWKQKSIKYYYNNNFSTPCFFFVSCWSLSLCFSSITDSFQIQLFLICIDTFIYKLKLITRITLYIENKGTNDRKNLNIHKIFQIVPWNKIEWWTLRPMCSSSVGPMYFVLGFLLFANYSQIMTLELSCQTERVMVLILANGI